MASVERLPAAVGSKNRVDIIHETPRLEALRVYQQRRFQRNSWSFKVAARKKGDRKFIRSPPQFTSLLASSVVDDHRANSLSNVDGLQLAAVCRQQNQLSQDGAGSHRLAEHDGDADHGYSATRRLLHDGYSFPVVALTTHAMATDRQLCLDAGCDDYATKPIDRRNLLELVASYAERAAAGTFDSVAVGI